MEMSRKLSLTKQAFKFLMSLDKKQAQQISNSIIKLMLNPIPHDSESLVGATNGERRIDSGEFRIIYIIQEDIVEVLVIGKRNDDSVYKIWKQKY